MRDRIRNILLESISKRAYHFTNGAYNIIKENRLHASSAVGSFADMDRNKHRFYFISLTRSGIDGYNSGRQKIVMDGEKLGHKYKGGPVDYWSIPRDTKDQHGNLTTMRTGMEKEDRIFLNQPFIEDVRKYIVEVHDCLGGYNGKYREIELYRSAMLKQICDQYDIPVYFYLSKNDFLKEKKSARIKLEDLPEYQSQFEKGKEEKETIDKESQEFNTPERDRRYLVLIIGLLVPLLSLNNKKIEEEIKRTLFGIGIDDPWPEQIQKYEENLDSYLKYDNLKYPADYHEYITKISSDIHNIRTHRDDASVFILEILRRDMKKLGAKSISEYIEKKTGVFEYWEKYRRERK